MDPIITPIATNLAISLTKWGLTKIIRQIYPDFGEDKNRREIFNPGDISS